MPDKVRIYDDGGKTIDRYTLIVPSANEPGKMDMYGFNADPYHPQGFGQFGGSVWPMGSYSHLGKLVTIDELPEQAQRYVRETLTTPLPDGYGLPLPKTWGKRERGRKVAKRVKVKRVHPGFERHSLPPHPIGGRILGMRKPGGFPPPGGPTQRR